MPSHCRFFASALFVLFCAACIAGPPQAAAAPAQPVRLRFANFPAAGTFPCVSMDRWVEEVHKRADGAVRIETFPGGTLLEAKNMIRGVIQGQADIGCISVAYHPGAYPLLSAFELPLGFRTARAASAAMWDLHAKYRPEETSRIVVLALFSSAPAQMLGTRPLNTPEDFKGMRVRASGILADVAEKFGASPVSMPQSDTPEALRKGMIQGIFTSLDVMQDYNFAESCRHVLLMDMPFYPFMIFMNAEKWNSLPPELRNLITDMGREHSVWTGDYVDGHARDALRWSEQTYGVNAVALSPGQRAALLEKAAPLIGQWSARAEAKGIAARAVLEDIEAARAALEGRP
jgi:TRAP-type C4-dicarboxylate transport system substrate-binding protein